MSISTIISALIALCMIATPDTPPEAPQATPEPPAQAYEFIAEDWHEEAVYLAKTLYGEAGNCSPDQQAAVIWCILNRVDSEIFPDTVEDVATAPYQFLGYSASNPVEDRHYYMALDVLGRWQREKHGAENAGRVLPKEYCYFSGDLLYTNRFTTEYCGGMVWDWSAISPYEER